ncbi:MAG: hypothetical protein ACPKPY_10885 [Nitrososphaeraceae archaeon]
MNFIEYYFECYFNMSANYDEIESLIKEFIKIETKEYIDGFKDEITNIILSNDWDYIITIALRKGGRVLDRKKAEMLIKYLKILINEELVTKKPDFYKLNKK